MLSTVYSVLDVRSVNPKFEIESRSRVRELGRPTSKERRRSLTWETDRDMKEDTGRTRDRPRREGATWEFVPKGVPRWDSKSRDLLRVCQGTELIICVFTF